MSLSSDTRTMLIAALCWLCLGAAQALAENNSNPVYAQLTSSRTQLPGHKQEYVTMENVEGLSGLRTEGNTHIITKQSGLFFIMANGQVGSQGLGLTGNVHMYLMRNGKIIPNTGTIQTTSGTNAISNLIAQTVIHLRKGDSISIGINATSPSLGLIATDATSKSKATPSIIFSMFQLGSFKE